MRNKSIYILSFLFILSAEIIAQNPDSILLKNYRPKSIYKIQVTKLEKAKFPVIDLHSHPYAKSPEQIKEWIKIMDRFGIQKTMILSYATGARFDSIYRLYAPFADRFDVWCGFDYTGYKVEGSKKLECEMTIRGGKIVYDLNGIANPIVVKSK